MGRPPLASWSGPIFPRDPETRGPTRTRTRQRRLPMNDLRWDSRRVWWEGRATAPTILLIFSKACRGTSPASNTRFCNASMTPRPVHNSTIVRRRWLVKHCNPLPPTEHRAPYKLVHTTPTPSGSRHARPGTTCAIRRLVANAMSMCAFSATRHPQYHAARGVPTRPWSLVVHAIFVCSSTARRIAVTSVSPIAPSWLMLCTVGAETRRHCSNGTRRVR